MADYEFSKLKEKYRDFEVPSAVVTIDGRDFSENEDKLALTDIDVELTAGFEASIASFRIYNAFDKGTSKYEFDKVKPYIKLGSSVVICLGYCNVYEPVFCGYIARVNFIREKEDAPYIRVTAMDVKGIMMAGSYARQIKAYGYGAAVKQILEKTAVLELKSRNVIMDIQVTPTPDEQQPGNGQQVESARSIEMVSESDYEFVVKAAQKSGYEFFTEVGTVFFRKARSNESVLMEIGPQTGLNTIDVEYDTSGLVRQIEVRGMDADKAALISAKGKYKDKLSAGQYVKALLKGSEKAVIDASADSEETAKLRAEALLARMAFRFGSLSCEMTGLPELVPGRYINIVALGSPVENSFYLTGVRHRCNGDNGFYTELKGQARKLS